MRGAIGPAFTAPSGRMITWEEMNLLIQLERNRTIEWSEQDIKFNSGFLSRVYFRGRNDLTDHPALLRRVGHLLYEKIARLPTTHGEQKCLIGIPTAGSPLAQVIADLARVLWNADDPVCFRLMRSVLKDHGKDNMWVGTPDLEKHSYITVENIVSTAKAMLDNFGKLEQDGYPARDMHHMVFASWELGGTEKLPAAGYDKVHILFYMLDVIAAYVQQGLWPQERYDEMERRIKAWRAQHG